MIEKFKNVVLDIWREACQHINIIESVPLIVKMLVPHLPLSQLLIRRIDCAQFQIETIAVGFSDLDRCQDFITRKCTKVQIEKLVRWHQKGEILKRGLLKPDEKHLSFLLPLDNGKDVLAGPLGKQNDFLPVLILIAKSQKLFKSLHEEMLKVILEPFSIALENDSIIRDMVTLREAAEVDKKSLLVKLGRQEIGDTIIGAKNGLQTVMKRVEFVARSDVPVLIFGETGTGKELISRAIHNRSNRFK